MTTELINPSGRRRNSAEVPPSSVLRKTAGWPSPAQDYYFGDLDLNDVLITNPHSTFFMRVVGDAMLGAGIASGDTLVIDRSYTAQHGDIVIAIVEDGFLVRQLEHHKDQGRSIVRLLAANPQYPHIAFSPEQELQIWGVVTFCIHYLRPPTAHSRRRRS